MCHEACPCHGVSIACTNGDSSADLTYTTVQRHWIRRGDSSTSNNADSTRNRAVATINIDGTAGARCAA